MAKYTPLSSSIRTKWEGRALGLGTPPQYTVGCWETASLVLHLHIHDQALLPLPTHETSVLLLPASLPLQSRTMYWGKGGTLGDHGKAHASGSYTQTS